MRSSRDPRRPLGTQGMIIGLALALSLVGCRGESQQNESKGPDDPGRQETAAKQDPAATQAAAQAGATSPTAGETGSASGKTPSNSGKTGMDPEVKRVDTPEAQAALSKELEASRQQALAKREPVDPEVAKRMKDPEYRKQKDAMLNRLSQISTSYYQDGIEIRHTRKRPEWRLIDPKLAGIADAAERKRKGAELAKRFKQEVEPVLEKEIGVKVYADASESIEIY